MTTVGSSDTPVDRVPSMTKLYSYVVARDYGFAPNPFYGTCTLATCKPEIRKHAKVGDWIIGTGSSQWNKEGYLVYVMLVSETLTFNEYWASARFRQQRPSLRGSKKQAFGDNIYFKDEKGQWHQEDSHHSYRDGSANPHNISHDTQADRVLISTDYAYWGDSGPQPPQNFRNYKGFDICAKRGHKCRFPEDMVRDFVAWLRTLDATGYLGDPVDWRNTP